MVMLRFRDELVMTGEQSNHAPKQPEIVVDVDRCKACGSESLFDGWFDRDGYTNTAGAGTFTTICNQCGQDQNKRVRVNRKRRS